MSAKAILTKEQRQLFKENQKGKTAKEMSEWCFEQFGIRLTEQQIRNQRDYLGVQSGLTGQYQKGHTPWTSGKKGLCTNTGRTHFTKGDNRGNNQPLPLCTERFWKNLYYVKIEQPDVWKEKHLLLWEQAYGEIPEGKCVIFIDGDSTNCVLENLRLVSKNANRIRGLKKLKTTDKNLNELGVAIAEAYAKTRG